VAGKHEGGAGRRHNGVGTASSGNNSTARAQTHSTAPGRTITAINMATELQGVPAFNHLQGPDLVGSHARSLITILFQKLTLICSRAGTVQGEQVIQQRECWRAKSSRAIGSMRREKAGVVRGLHKEQQSLGSLPCRSPAMVPGSRRLRRPNSSLMLFCTGVPAGESSTGGHAEAQP
jgi:hypothetical protein